MSLVHKSDRSSQLPRDAPQITPSISEDDESEDDDESDEGIMHLVCACCML